MVKRHWSYGIALPYGVSVFIEFGNVWQHVQSDWLLKGMEIFQTLQTWKVQNTTRYHNFNVFPHALPYIFLSLTCIDHRASRYHNFTFYHFLSD